VYLIFVFIDKMIRNDFFESILNTSGALLKCWDARL